MGLSMFNPEGYSDLTAYEAIRNLEKQKWRSLVYICSPYSGDVEENTRKARRFSRFAVDQGAIPLAPHLCLDGVSSSGCLAEKLPVGWQQRLRGLREREWQSAILQKNVQKLVRGMSRWS